MTFGVISLNTRMKKVTASVPMVSDHSLSPNSLMVMTVTSAAAAALSRLLPSRITPSSLSVLSSSWEVSFAPRCPRLTRYFRR